MAADNARADGLGLVFDSDPRRTSKDGGSADPNAATGDAAAGEATATAAAPRP
jgi:hypothetical protein